MAVETSTKQMALTRDVGPGGFMERVTAVMAFVAGKVLTESPAIPHHQPRAYYAQKVVADPTSAGIAAGPQIVMGVNITSTTTYDETTGKSTCTATDAQLESQVTTLWNSLGGIDAPATAVRA
jgi:hypothetical protein